MGYVNFKIPDMTNKLYSIAIALMASLIIGCSKQVDQQQGLAGAWEWKSTDGGLGFHLHETPATTGKSEQLILTNNLRYSRYTNHVVTEEGAYTLTDRTCIHDKKSKTVIQFSGALQDIMVESMDRKKLVLSDEHYDGFEFIYERKNEKGN